MNRRTGYGYILLCLAAGALWLGIQARLLWPVQVAIAQAPRSVSQPVIELPLGLPVSEIAAAVGSNPAVDRPDGVPSRVGHRALSAG